MTDCWQTRSYKDADANSEDLLVELVKGDTEITKASEQEQETDCWLRAKHEAS